MDTKTVYHSISSTTTRIHQDTNLRLPNEVSSRGGSGVSFSSLTSLSEEKQRRWPCHRVPTRMSRPLSPRGRQRLKAASAPWSWTRDLGSASANIAMEDGKIMKVTRVTRVQRECESLPAINWKPSNVTRVLKLGLASCECSVLSCTFNLRILTVDSTNIWHYDCSCRGGATAWIGPQYVFLSGPRKAALSIFSGETGLAQNIWWTCVIIA